MDIAFALIRFKCQPAFAMGFERRNRLQPLSDKRGNMLGQARKFKALTTIAAGKRALKFGILQTQSGIAEGFGIFKEIVDDDYRCGHRISVITARKAGNSSR